MSFRSALLLMVVVGVMPVRLKAANEREKSDARISSSEREQARPEVKCGMELLRDFLRQHAHEMPRTMLRYAIEKMTEQERRYWMRIQYPPSVIEDATHPL